MVSVRVWRNVMVLHILDMGSQELEDTHINLPLVGCVIITDDSEHIFNYSCAHTVSALTACAQLCFNAQQLNHSMSTARMSLSTSGFDTVVVIWYKQARGKVVLCVPPLSSVLYLSSPCSLGFSSVGFPPRTGW